ncbi:hypothetical protein HO173_005702 [Letharia columbiana]|uniref:Uncharacterized protein n=1 Tax=Letharia columbiana TaxID=112416 RepID=A0A8H6L576_9LECA|nr:uncharacterized protein HO173_005702 [Letharia columbiana]KAF6236074.1 hypothetical protein HO173_005702 [Letharia columbiana]
MFGNVCWVVEYAVAMLGREVVNRMNREKLERHRRGPGGFRAETEMEVFDEAEERHCRTRRADAKM